MSGISLVWKSRNFKMNVLGIDYGLKNVGFAIGEQITNSCSTYFSKKFQIKGNDDALPTAIISCKCYLYTSHAVFQQPPRSSITNTKLIVRIT